MPKTFLLRSFLTLSGLLSYFVLFPQNGFSWTDDPLTAGTTRIRAVHITELQTVVDSKRSNFGFSAYSWTTTPGTGARVRAADITDLRTAIDDIRSVYRPLCASTMSASGGWTDTITAGTTRIRATHVTELRSAIDSVGSCSACVAAAGGCRVCSGASGLTFATAGTDPHNTCSPSASPTCGTGNCDGAGNCATNPVTCYQDSDTDSHGNASVTQTQCGSCSGGYVAVSGDCCDNIASVNPDQTFQTTAIPGAPVCTPTASKNNTYDWNCNGSIEADTTAITNAWRCDIDNTCGFYASYNPTNSDCGKSIRYYSTTGYNVNGGTCSGTTACAPTGSLNGTRNVGCK